MNTQDHIVGGPSSDICERYSTGSYPEGLAFTLGKEGREELVLVHPIGPKHVQPLGNRKWKIKGRYMDGDCYISFYDAGNGTGLFQSV